MNQLMEEEQKEVPAQNFKEKYEEALRDIEMLQMDKRHYFEEIKRRDEKIREMDVQMQQKDLDLASMASVIQSASDKIEAMMDRLGVPRQGEEAKEELEDKLIRLIQQAASLVRDGVVTYKNQNPVA